MQQVVPEGTTRRHPAARLAARRDDVARPAVRLGSAALGRLRELELAIDELAGVEPRGSELASVISLAVERLERHHLRRYAAIVQEHLAA